jgi:hypothetical protein
LRVVFPGRRWGGPGPDFKGALLADAQGALLSGDVEVHLRSSNWNGHRHAQDPAYARVVLQVVRTIDAMALDVRGEHVPTVELLPLPPTARLPRRRAAARGGPCLRSAPAVLSVVEAAGRARFRARSARYEGDLAMVPPDQALWRGVAEAVGYTRNTEPFGELADGLPWAVVAEVLERRGPVGLAGALLGTAGLLSEATLPEAHAWRVLQRTLGVRPALSGRSWDRRQVRPGNAPAARCRGLAEIAAGWVRRAGRAHASPSELVLQAVEAAAGQPRPQLWPLVRASPWIGRGRAQVIVVNVLLPFAAAAGIPRAEALFDRLPGEPSNRIVRYMAAQLGAARFRGACHQQGLVQLFQQTCAARACERCPARRGGARLSATTEEAEASYE